jgi:hypothetical protein
MKLLHALSCLLRLFLLSRSQLILENLALRQQLTVLSRTTTAITAPSGPSVLDLPIEIVVGLAFGPRPGPAENRSVLAPAGLPSVLALAITPQARRATTARQRPSRSDQTHGTREPGLGRATYPGRAVPPSSCLTCVVVNPCRTRADF